MSSPVRAGRAARHLLVVALAATVAVGAIRPGDPAPARAAEPPPAAAAPRAAMPLYFVENRGQVDDRVAYYVAGPTTSAFLRRGGLTFSLAAPRQRLPEPASLAPPTAAAAARIAAAAAPRPRAAVALDFLGADPAVQPVGQDPASARVSYFKGPRATWKTGLPTFGGVRYPDLWPGIDLVYSGAGGQLKYTFLVHPGADPASIRLAYRGPTDVHLTPDGALAVSTAAGAFLDAPPYAYQDAAGRATVPSAYHLVPGADPNTWTYSFDLGAYDHSQTLVLDPTLLFYAGYIGGSGFDAGAAVAVDAAGNAYVAGSTDSAQDFPVEVGPDPTYNGGGSEGGGIDAFVAKINADGTALLYAGYIGGRGIDIARGVGVDAAGNAVVAGFTSSPGPVTDPPDPGSFPVAGAATRTKSGGLDAFVAKVSPDGSSLLYSGFVGGDGDDAAYAVAVDAAGDAYLAGSTDSAAPTSFPPGPSAFPARVGPALTKADGVDAFVARVGADGALQYAGFVGGAGFDAAYGVAVDGAGSAYLAGTTASGPSDGFPVRLGPSLTKGAGLDAFVAKVAPSGDDLAYAGYVGGGGDDLANAIAVDATGRAVAAGSTTSPAPPSAGAFPARVGPSLTYGGAGPFAIGDAFVARVAADGAALEYAGYIGGAGDDSANGVALDAAGHAFVVGTTGSDQGFPTLLGPGLAYGGGPEDAFAAEVGADGASLLYVGFLGGDGDDAANGVAADALGHAYLVGSTDSSADALPVATDSALARATGVDAFVARLDPAPPPTATPTATSSATATETATSTATSTATATTTETATTTPTESATSTATETATSTATETATSTATESPTTTPTETATGTATGTPTPTPTLRPTSTSTRTATPTSSVTSTSTATAVPPTATSSATSTPTAPPPTGTPTPTNSATAVPPTATASRTPTAAAPTSTPTPTIVPCPPGRVSLRWHYSANGTSGSWSATTATNCPGSVTIGPQAMEGDLKLAPGTMLNVGYDLSLPGNSASLTVTVNNPTLVFTVRCVSGAAPSASTLTAAMPTRSYAVTGSGWYPSGDQHSPLVYQASIPVPNLCGGGQVRFDKGGTFTATVS